MAYRYYNPNPYKNQVGDCAVRAIAKALNRDWENAYIGLCAQGLDLGDMPSSNYVWGMYLIKNGFQHKMVESICPACTTVAQFAREHNKGTYVLGCEGHVLTAIDGDYYDSWDSGNKTVLFFYKQEE
jgi:hypothetical protein